MIGYAISIGPARRPTLFAPKDDNGRGFL